MERGGPGRRVRRRASEGLSQGLSTILLFLPPRFGEHPLLGHAERPPDAAISEVKDPLERRFEGDDDAGHRLRHREAVVAEVLKSLGYGGLDFEARVDGVEAPRRVPPGAGGLAPGPRNKVPCSRTSGTLNEKVPRTRPKGGARTSRARFEDGHCRGAASWRATTPL
jgi:hypothetical protein